MAKDVQRSPKPCAATVPVPAAQLTDVSRVEMLDVVRQLCNGGWEDPRKKQARLIKEQKKKGLPVTVFQRPDKLALANARYLRVFQDAIASEMVHRWMKTRLWARMTMTPEQCQITNLSTGPQPWLVPVSADALDLKPYEQKCAEQGLLYRFDAQVFAQDTSLLDTLRQIETYLKEKANRVILDAIRQSSSKKGAGKPKALIKFDYLEQTYRFDRLEDALNQINREIQDVEKQRRAEMEDVQRAERFLAASHYGNEKLDIPMPAGYEGKYEVLLLKSPKALQFEGDQMGHCVGGYAKEVRSGEKVIYSIRDAQGYPHVTFELQKGRIQQCKGHGNKSPVAEYQPIVAKVIEFLKQKHGSAFDIDGDQNFACCVRHESGEWFSLFDIPKEYNPFVIEGDVRLAGLNLKTLPDLTNVVIEGNLDISNNPCLRSLEGLPQVRGTINAANTRFVRFEGELCDIFSLPDGAVVTGDIALSETRLTNAHLKKLANLSLQGKLDISNNKGITQLPDGLKAKEIDASNCSITHIGKVQTDDLILLDNRTLSRGVDVAPYSKKSAEITWPKHLFWQNGEWYNVFDLPAGLQIEVYLDLSEMDYLTEEHIADWVKKGIVFRRGLNVTQNPQITKLPSGLKAKEIIANYCSIGYVGNVVTDSLCLVGNNALSDFGILTPYSSEITETSINYPFHWFQQDGKWYNALDLPVGLQVEQHLNLSSMNLTDSYIADWVQKGIVFNGGINIANNLGITTLKGLKAKIIDAHDCDVLDMGTVETETLNLKGNPNLASGQARKETKMELDNGYFCQDGVIYHVTNLPENMVVRVDVNASDIEITDETVQDWIQKGVVFEGDLNIADNSKITSLDGLKAKSINACGCDIREVNSVETTHLNLVGNENLMICRMLEQTVVEVSKGCFVQDERVYNVRNLPENMVVNCDVEAARIDLTDEILQDWVQKGIVFKGYLNIADNSKITSLNGLKAKSINASNCDIQDMGTVDAEEINVEQNDFLFSGRVPEKAKVELNRNGCFYQDGVIYHVANLPENLIVNCDVNASGIDLPYETVYDWVRKGIVFNGKLDISHQDIFTLPDGLKAKTIDAQGCHIRKVGSVDAEQINLKNNDKLSICRTPKSTDIILDIGYFLQEGRVYNIRQLPPNLIVTVDVDVSGWGLFDNKVVQDWVRKGIVFKGKLDVSDNRITTLDGLKAKSINAANCNIQDIGIVEAEEVDLRGNKKLHSGKISEHATVQLDTEGYFYQDGVVYHATNLPENLIVECDVNASGIGLTDEIVRDWIQKGVVFKGKLDVSNNPQITSLDGLNAKAINAIGCGVKEIHAIEADSVSISSDVAFPNGWFHGVGGWWNIFKLPDGFEVGADVYLEDTGLTDEHLADFVQKGIVFKGKLDVSRNPGVTVLPEGLTAKKIEASNCSIARAGAIVTDEINLSGNRQLSDCGTFTPFTEGVNETAVVRPKHWFQQKGGWYNVFDLPNNFRVEERLTPSDIVLTDEDMLALKAKNIVFYQGIDLSSQAGLSKEIKEDKTFQGLSSWKQSWDRFACRYMGHTAQTQQSVPVQPVEVPTIAATPDVKAPKPPTVDTVEAEGVTLQNFDLASRSMRKKGKAHGKKTQGLFARIKEHISNITAISKARGVTKDATPKTEDLIREIEELKGLIAMAKTVEEKSKSERDLRLKMMQLKDSSSTR